jgi:hypothetical protein
MGSALRSLDAKWVDIKLVYLEQYWALSAAWDKAKKQKLVSDKKEKPKGKKKAQNDDLVVTKQSLPPKMSSQKSKPSVSKKKPVANRRFL